MYGYVFDQMIWQMFRFGAFPNSCKFLALTSNWNINLSVKSGIRTPLKSTAEMLLLQSMQRAQQPM